MFVTEPVTVKEKLSVTENNFGPRQEVYVPEIYFCETTFSARKKISFRKQVSVRETHFCPRTNISVTEHRFCPIQKFMSGKKASVTEESY